MEIKVERCIDTYQIRCTQAKLMWPLSSSLVPESKVDDASDAWEIEIGFLIGNGFLQKTACWSRKEDKRSNEIAERISRLSGGEHFSRAVDQRNSASFFLDSPSSPLNRIPVSFRSQPAIQRGSLLEFRWARRGKKLRPASAKLVSTVVSLPRELFRWVK